MINNYFINFAILRINQHFKMLKESISRENL